MTRIALDAMGGDHGPSETVSGALKALAEDSALEIVLVGREDEISRNIPDASSQDRISIFHASEVIGSDESPADALRKKRDSSIVKCFELASEGHADAVVSAGNTGAVVGGATFIWRLVPGIRKAGIAISVGTRSQKTIVVDVGANIHCKPRHLLHYGIMAGLYSELLHGTQNPRIGLMNIGTEEAKGNQLVKETSELFEQAPFNFIGHVEGNDLFADRADVIVCEGFVGNVMLKVCEGLSEAMHTQFREILESGRAGDDGSVNATMQEFKNATDYAEIGGAPLLGVNGTCVICHGKSDHRALGNAVKLAGKFVTAKFLETITEGLAAHQAT